MVKDTIALSKLKQRIENAPPQIDNGKLPAGSSMYFYCKMCGHLADKLPESYVSPPRRTCASCKELLDANPGITPSTLVDLAKEVK